ncbi:cytochrome c biogenesis protein ResB [Methylobacillus gramineus]|uniref:cytochrome c biogenesis protein ResB n=1 Tax=Methylobacillus gramineus TaxID=755169 RepID=UPI001CFFC75C|nr:cytochrome c biogenesis protein ResB [Methylobacillus gramineus]MCB5185616.1 cytochrome c biogenesis protein ResB [Methylobacillus gramineus]
MRFAVSVLVVLGIASIIGTVLKQNEPYTNYIVQFGQFWFEFFEFIGLYDVYHSAWFLVILIFLVLSTSLCIYRNSPIMLRELRAFRENVKEASLRSFSHQHEYHAPYSTEETQSRLAQFLTVHSFRFRTVEQEDGSRLFAAKAGSYQRLGYILTHAAIVMICIGGLIDGNVPLKLQELLGYTKIETRDIAEKAVPPESRLSPSNLSFRANMTLPEGAGANAAFMRVRDGYLVQELPFSIALKTFRIQHYDTGQPKSFESDIMIIDPEVKDPITATIKVNHPLIYKGIAIYQSDFGDGGSRLDFKVWNIFGSHADAIPFDGNIFNKYTVSGGDSPLSVELMDFRLFNILNLSVDGKGKPRNVGPNVTFKVRDAQGQAHEYVNYLNPLLLDGRRYFMSGVRAMQQDTYRYLRIPADEDDNIEGYMNFRAAMFDQSLYPEIVRRVSKVALSGHGDVDADMRSKFEASLMQLLQAFSQGGFGKVAEMIDAAVPEAQRAGAAQAYLKVVTSAAFEAYAISRERAGLPPATMNEALQPFVEDSLHAMSDTFHYGAPLYLQPVGFDHRQSSGLQLTRSPGKTLVYSGSVLLVLGIFSMLYIRERRIWLLVKPDTHRVLFAMTANRKNRDFDIEFSTYREKLARLLENQHL